MKRLLLLFLLAMAPLAARAQLTTASDGNGGLIITGYTPANSITTLAIPATIGGQTVTGIGSDAFLNFFNLQSVTIANSVTSIGSEAFENCSLLTSVTFGSGLTSIGDNAFNNCASLGTIAIPNSVTTLGQSVFSGDGNLTSVTIGTGVTSLGYQTFYMCTNLPSITIPPSVTSIGQQAFYFCLNLATVSMGSGVTSIGDEAFLECESLTTITIPSSVTSIGVGPFGLCVSLTSITVASLNSTYSSSVDGVLFDKAKATLIQFPGGKTGSYVIPATVTSIANEAFYGAESVTSVTIPSGVTTVGPYTFRACTALTSVTIPASVTTLGDLAFSSCTALTGLTIPSAVTSIGQMTFSHDTSLTTVTIPNSVTTIQQQAFQSCSGLQTVTLGSGLTAIGPQAFNACPNLTGALFRGNAPTTGSSIFPPSTDNPGFAVSYYKAATGFATPTWTDSAGDPYPATALITPQTITFPAIGTVPYPSSPITLVASASSGLAVTFVYVSGPASLSGNTLTFTGTGMVTIQATQPGNGTYAAATPVSQTFSVETGQSLSTWQSTYNITNLAATPFGDGVPNLLKYLYHIDPTTTIKSADRSALPVVGKDTTTTPGMTYLTLTYREYAVASGVTVNVQSSPDLLTWTTVTPDITAQTGTDANTNDPIYTVEVKVTAPKQFIRLNVTAP